MRALVLGSPASSYVWESLAWYAGIIIVFAPPGAWLYQRNV